MKKPTKASAHFPFYGNDFFAALEGYSDAVIVGYLRALWHYWHHCHCDGLPNDDDYLRRICRCEPPNWNRTKGVIFDDERFFKLEKGKWHQGRCREEHIKTITIYNAKVAAIALARKHNPVNSPVTSTDNSETKPPVSKLQPEPEPEPEPYSDSEAEPKVQTHNGHPSLKEVQALASIRGIPPEEAERFWNHFESSGWIDKNGHPVVRWESKLATWTADSRARPLESEHHSPTKAKTVYEIKTVMETKNQIAADIRARYCSETGMSTHWSDPTQKEKYFAIKKEVKTLKNQLAAM